MKHPRSHVTALIAVATPLLLASFAARADGVEVVVRVSGIATSSGEIGCALFPDGAAFPMDASGARHVWIPAEATGVLCRFTDIPAGRWAVSVSHDLNGNRKVDTNLLGIPREAWGVSNNVRPRLRAPRFDEAAFEIVAGQPTTLDIRVAK
jgi:uncharacterized protein (DUF2141 family)